MNRTPFAYAWLVMSLVGTCLGQPEDGSLDTSCLVKARSDKDAIRVMEQVINTTGVAGPFLHPKIRIQVSEVTDGVVKVRVLTTGAPNATDVLDHIMARLPEALGRVYEEKKARIDLDLRQAWDQKMEALAKLQPRVPSDRPTQATLEQLEETVDLSGLRPDAPLADAVDMLRKAVTPPVNIVVLWQELQQLGIEMTSPVLMDGIRGIKLETGLKLLLKAVSGADIGGPAELDYTVQDGVITIGTKGTVESLRPRAARSPAEGLDEGRLRERKQELHRSQKDLEMDLAELRAGMPAMEEQVAAMKKQIEAQVENDPLTKEIQQLAALLSEQTQQIRRQIEAGRASEADYAQAAERLVKVKIDLARQREAAFAAAGGQHIADLRYSLSDKPVSLAILEAKLRATRDQLAKIDTQLDQAAAMAPKEIERAMAVRSLQDAEQRIFELSMRAAALQPPWITIPEKD